MRFDERKKGFAGLVVMEPIPELNLCSGDCLMASADLGDIHDFQKVQAPCVLKFFRIQGNEYLNFVTPLFGVHR